MDAVLPCHPDCSGFSTGPQQNAQQTEQLTEQIEGQRLEKIEVAEATDQEWDMQLITALSLSLLFFLGGVFLQMRPVRVETA